MLGQRRRRWPNIKTTLVQRLLSAGQALCQIRDSPVVIVSECMLLPYRFVTYKHSKLLVRSKVACNEFPSPLYSVNGIEIQHIIPPGTMCDT